MVRIAERLSELQRAALADAEVSIDNMGKVAGIADQEKRDKAVTSRRRSLPTTWRKRIPESEWRRVAEIICEKLGL